MSPERTCPDCGRSLPADAPRGLCPECLMRAGLSRSSSGGFAPTVTGVLGTIAQSCGAVPRVLLRGTTPGEQPGPIVRKPDADDADTSTRYRIDGEIARGGMGAVLKGRDPDLGRDVALKVLREDLRENADMVRRFVEEAQIGGQLRRPQQGDGVACTGVVGHDWRQLADRASARAGVAGVRPGRKRTGRPGASGPGDATASRSGRRRERPPTGHRAR
jgi:hypothetical protein